MKHTKTAIIIPNWNGQDLLRQCIDSLLAQSLASTIIVVENGSVDESDKILASYGKKIVVLKQKVNLGFAGGVNVGIRYAIDNGYDYVALFNNDALAHKNWLKELVKTAKQDSNIGIVTCKFMRIDKKTLDSTGEFYTIFGLPYPRGRNQPDNGQYDNNVDVFGASGGASLYSISMLKQIGLFDEDFFAYFEDVDISFRAQIYGYDVKYTPKAIAYHHIGASSGKISGFSSYQTAKNFWILYTKNMPSWLYFKYLPLASYWFVRMFVARLIKGGFVPFFKGWLKGLWLLPSTLKKRHNVQANRQVSAKYIDSILIHHKPPKPAAK